MKPHPKTILKRLKFWLKEQSVKENKKANINITNEQSIVNHHVSRRDSFDYVLDKIKELETED